MFSNTFSAFVKQRVRWSRNSYRCYITAIHKGWLWQVAFVTKVTVLQILLTPVTMGVTIGYLLFSRLELTALGVTLAVGWLFLGRGIRGWSHLSRHPWETMSKQGWLTRTEDQTGGAGQTAATLTPAEAH